MTAPLVAPGDRLDVPGTATWCTPHDLAVTAGGRALARALPEGLPGTRALVRSQLARLFGVPDLRGNARAPFEGLLGRDAVTGRVLGEPASIAGGVRGLMVQAAHPLAMAGVTEHSRYRAAPLERLEGTSTWVTTAAYATVEVVAAQARRVRAMHRPVVGTFEGAPYAAGDPRLLIWISVALTSSFLAAHQLLAPVGLGTDEADAFVAEQARVAALLDPRLPLDDLDPHELPRLDLDALPLVRDGLPTDRAGLAATLAGFVPELQVTPAAREAIGFLWQVDVPPAVAPVYGGFLDAVAASLPPDLARTLDVLPDDRDAALARLANAVALLRGTTGRSPSWHRARRLLAA